MPGSAWVEKPVIWVVCMDCRSAVDMALICVAPSKLIWALARAPMSVVEKSRMVPSTNRRSVGLSVRSNSLPSRVLQESAARISRIFDVMQLERAVP